MQKGKNENDSSSKGIKPHVIATLEELKKELQIERGMMSTKNSQPNKYRENQASIFAVLKDGWEKDADKMWRKLIINNYFLKYKYIFND